MNDTQYGSQGGLRKAIEGYVDRSGLRDLRPSKPIKRPGIMRRLYRPISCRCPDNPIAECRIDERVR